MTKLIGILAYGSLIGRPGPEIEPEIVSRRHNILTPFRVEFVRASKTRGGAPTLVPVSNGGSAVLAQILLLDLPEQEVKDRLWRRETSRVGQGGHYRNQKNPGPDTLIIDRHNNLAGIDIVFSARFAANIESPSPKRLAELAINSVRRSEAGHDGITYLIDAKRDGIVTPLSEAYEKEILRRTQTSNLLDALQKVKMYNRDSRSC